MRSFIEACWDLREAGMRLMVERAGIASVASYALGAVEMIQSAITAGDSFSVGALQKAPLATGKTRFAAPQRVYVEALGSTVERKVAERLMSSNRGRLHFACKDPTCCPNGYRDMLADPERHSALARQRQYQELSQVPPSLRAGYFVDQMITPVCDMLARAADLHRPFREMQRRMLSIKEVLTDLERERRDRSGRAVSGESPLPARETARVIPLNPREPRGR